MRLTVVRPTIARPAAVTALAVALAACGGARRPTGPTGPAGPEAGAVVTIAAAKSPDYEAWIFDDHGALPAIAGDGSAVAALFHDEVDFVGSPVDTLVIWRIADGKELARVQVAVDQEAEPSDDVAGPAAKAAALAAQATAALAGHRWLPVTGSATVGERGDDDAPGPIRLGDGRTLRLDMDRGALVIDRGTVSPDSFASPGSMMAMEGEEGGSCGFITGLDVVAGGRAGDDWILLQPHANLGGDSCFGSLGVDLALFARLGE
jgi:hypothetical protein